MLLISSSQSVILKYIWALDSFETEGRRDSNVEILSHYVNKIKETNVPCYNVAVASFSRPTSNITFQSMHFIHAAI